MRYVALLRGINVGGNNKVDMKTLKRAFEEAGMEDVITYINSGNIIFSHKEMPHAKLAAVLEKIIEKEFRLAIKVLLRDLKNLKAVAKTLPASWQTNAEMKCDVMFLWEEVDSPEVLKQLTIKEGLDDVKYVPGAILWRVDKKDVTRSGLMKIVGSKLYKLMTIRNCNTLRKLVEMMEPSPVFAL